MRNWKTGLSIIIAGIALWMMIDYLHYSPPNLETEEIKRLSKVQLEKELSDILNCSRHINKEQVKVCDLEVLDVRELDKKTYLVFKVDYQLNGVEQDPLNNKRYILGLRLVEKKLGGIALRQGAEFEVKYTGFYPADCGRHEDGVFYGFCKDPRVSKIVLRSNDFNSEQEVKNRIIIAKIPPGRDEVYPEFWDKQGRQIQPTNAMRVAFIAPDSQILQKYKNQPFTGWNQDLDEIDYLTSGTVDVVWIFPAFKPGVLQGTGLAALKKLINEEIPVIFWGEKDPQNIAAIFNMQDSYDKVNDPEDIAAVYVGAKQEGMARIGAISGEEGREFPILQKSIALRYQLDIFDNENEAQPEEGSQR